MGSVPQQPPPRHRATPGRACRKPVHPECERKDQAAAAQRRAAKKEAKANRPLSLVEENRLPLARQDQIREQRRVRNAPK
ncbi:hypothetical protein ACFWJT_14300 [Streptomyces sp. NPDC127069]|uniref:hypothetical protein n=1 Tax=Streptomyces sp. NPDC127069 TaxID=3347128 RepID=UPI003664DCAF